MKENIKIGLLGIIALTVVVNTFFMDDSPQRRSTPETYTTPQSNIATTPAPNPLQTSTPITPPTTPIPPVQLSESRTKTNMDFAEITHNFGTIQQDSKNTKIFKFTNTGAEPLIIEDAKGSCGCTVPVYPREPIKPGDTGEIEVVYSPGKQQGSQNKTITITANTNPISTTLNITANVEIVK
jgi:hypothetical protein